MNTFIYSELLKPNAINHFLNEILVAIDIDDDDDDNVYENIFFGEKIVILKVKKYAQNVVAILNDSDFKCHFLLNRSSFEVLFKEIIIEYNLSEENMVGEKSKTINMSTLNTVETLFSLSLNQLCQTMNEDTLQYAFKSSTPLICIHIMWKVLGLNIYANHLCAEESGYNIAQMDFEPVRCRMSYDLINPEIFEPFAANQQCALGIARILFDYYNLNTAIILTNYACDRHKYPSDEATSEAIRCILQAIFIVQKIGVPNDNMLLVNAHLIKSLIIQEITFKAELQNLCIYIHIENAQM